VEAPTSHFGAYDHPTNSFRAVERSLLLLFVLAGLGLARLAGRSRRFGMATQFAVQRAAMCQLLRLQCRLASRELHAPEAEGAWQPVFDSLSDGARASDGAGASCWMLELPRRCSRLA
jgi:hypothetical protein